MPEKEIKYGLKAVSICADGVLLSWSGHGMRGYKMRDGYETYTENAWTQRTVGHGPLAVFDTWEDTAAFVRACPCAWKATRPQYAIYRCVYVSSEHTGYWYGYPNGRVTHRCEESYDGKVYADAVCLLERVWVNGEEIRDAA